MIPLILVVVLVGVAFAGGFIVCGLMRDGQVEDLRRRLRDLGDDEFLNRYG